MHVERVERSQLGLDRIRSFELILIGVLVVLAGETDDAVRIDEPGRHHSGLANLVPVGDADAIGRTDGGDLAVRHDDDPVLDRVARHGVDDFPPDGDLRVGGRSQNGGDQQRGCRHPAGDGVLSPHR